MTSTYNFVPRVKVESPDIDPAIEAIYAVLMENEPEIASKPWHSDDHLSTREIMEGCIGQLIMKRRPRASKQWVEKLPEVCKQVEKRLYMIASSIDE